MSILVRALSDAPITTASSANLESSPNITVTKANLVVDGNGLGRVGSSSGSEAASNIVVGGALGKAPRLLGAFGRQQLEIFAMLLVFRFMQLSEQIAIGIDRSAEN